MGELEESEVVFNPGAAASNNVAVENKPMQGDPIEDNSDVVFNPDAGAFDMVADKKVDNINLEDYTGYLGSDIYGDNVADLNKSRAINQTWYGQAGNMVGQAIVGEIIGGTIEGLGYLLDVEGMASIAKGEEKEWGNWLSDYGKDIREASQDAMPIYQVNEGSFDMSDSGWWFSNGVSVASSLSMMLPSMAATRALGMLGKGLSKGAGMINKSLDVASKMGKQAKWASQGVSQAIVSRHIENSMEASGTFDSYKAEKLTQIDPQTGEKFTEERATNLAADAAASNYKAGWAMLLQDIPQYLAIGKVFNPRTMKMESALKKASGAGKVSKMGKFGQVAKGAGITFVSEGLEESYQYYIAERGKLLSDLKAGLINEDQYEKELSSRIGDEEMLSSAFWGGLGGNLFQAAGKGVGEAFKSKTQRENEKNYAKMQGDFLKKRGESFKLMQQELAAADESGDPERRETAMNDMMLSMTIEALELDKYEQHIETLANTMEMSKEEADAFAKEQGIELNQELFKKYAPQAIEKSKRIKKTYENYLNKNDSSVAAHLTRNDVQIYEFEETIKNNRKSTQSLRQDTPGYDEMSEPNKNKIDNDTKIKALKIANQVHENNGSKDADKESFNNKNRAKLIKANEKKIEALEKDNVNQKEELKNRTPKEVAADSRYGTGYKSAQGNILDNAVSSTMLEDGIVSRQNENAELKKTSYQQELKSKQFVHVIRKRLIDEDSAAKLKEEVANGDFTPKQKETLNKDIDDRLKILTDQAAVDKAAADKASEVERLNKELDQKENDNPSAIVDKGVTGNINNVLDDPYADEEADLDGQNSDRDDHIVEKKVKSSGAVGLLDQLSGTEGLDNYKTWSENGESKIGQEITYELDLGDYTGNDPNILAAIGNYYAMEDNPVINPMLVNFLPIKARVNSSVHTFLPTLTKGNTRFEEVKKERAAILELLFSGKEAKTTITHTSGGSIVQDLSDPKTGMVPEYSVSDLQQIASNNDVVFMVTNEEGELVDMNKEFVAGFDQRITVGDNTTDGTPMPYRGGVFMMVKKADGTDFPMKLNLGKNTPEQATVLADLIIRATVTKEGQKAELSYGLPLELLPDDVRLSIETVMGPEVAALKVGKEDDPTLLDIINMFTYVSDRTSGYKSRLYSEKGKVYFGSEGKSIGIGQAESEESRNELIDFLTNVKRRQFSLDLYNNFPGYKDFAIDNKIVSTNSTITGPLFQNDFSYTLDGKPAGRRVQAYVAPIYTAEKESSNDNATAKIIPLNPEERSGVQKDPGIVEKNSYYMELTDLIKEKYPNKNYYSLTETLVNGKYVVKTFNGITVPSKKLAELEQFKVDFFASKGIAHVSEYKAITQKTTTVESTEERVKDSQIPVSKQTFTVQNDSDDTIIVDVTTQLDGSRKIVQKLDDGSVVSSEKISKDNTLTSKDYVSKAYGDVKSTEDVDIKTVMNPKLESRMSDRQRDAAGFPESKSPTVNDSEIRNTEDNTVSLPESKKSVANLIKDSKNASTSREVKNVGRRKSKKSKVKKVTKSKTDIDNLNSGPIDTDCKG